MSFLDKCKDFFFCPPRRIKDSPYNHALPDFNANPLVGSGGNAYAFKQFQTLPVVNMLMGNGRIPTDFFKPLGQNNLVALRPAGPPQDVIGIPVGETELFPEPTEV